MQVVAKWCHHTPFLHWFMWTQKMATGVAFGRVGCGGWWLLCTTVHPFMSYVRDRHIKSCPVICRHYLIWSDPKWLVSVPGVVTQGAFNHYNVAHHWHCLLFNSKRSLHGLQNFITAGQNYCSCVCWNGCLQSERYYSNIVWVTDPTD